MRSLWRLIDAPTRTLEFAWGGCVDDVSTISGRCSQYLLPTASSTRLQFHLNLSELWRGFPSLTCLPLVRFTHQVRRIRREWFVVCELRRVCTDSCGGAQRAQATAAAGDGGHPRSGPTAADGDGRAQGIGTRTAEADRRPQGASIAAKNRDRKSEEVGTSVDRVTGRTEATAFGSFE